MRRYRGPAGASVRRQPRDAGRGLHRPAESGWQVRLSLPTLRIEGIDLRIEGIDGRKLTAAENTILPVPDGLTYAWLDRSRLGDRLLTDTAAMRLWAVAQEKPPQRRGASPIVLRFGFDRQTFTPKSDGYHLAAGAVHKVPLVVHVFNLSSQARRLVLTPTCSNDRMRLTGSSAADPGCRGRARNSSLGGRP